MKAILERVVITVNMAVLALVLFLAFRPGGPARSAWTGWRAQRQQAQRLREAWPQLVAGASKVGMGQTARIVEFSDYECPFCKQTDVEVAAATARDSTMAIVVRHFPLPMHPMARGAALAAICAEAQGRFEAMHRQLFSSIAWQADSNWTREATQAGVPNVPKFRACLASAATEERLNSDVTLGRSLNVNATPTFLSLGARRDGTVSESLLVSWSKAK